MNNSILTKYSLKEKMDDETLNIIRTGNLSEKDLTNFYTDGEIDFAKLKKIDYYLLSNNLYREFYAQLYNLLNYGPVDHIVDGKFIPTNEPFIFNVDLRDNSQDVNLNGPMMVYEYYNNSIFEFEGNMYDATDNFPYKNEQVYEVMFQIFKNPILFNFNKKGDLYLSMIMSYLNDAGYDMETFKNCKSLCEGESILGLLKKFTADKNENHIRKIANISGMDKNEAFMYLVNNASYEDLAAVNFMKELGFNVELSYDTSSTCDNIQVADTLLTYKAFLKTVCTKETTVDIPKSLCMPHFYVFVNSIGYCNGYQLEIYNDKLTTTAISSHSTDLLIDVGYKNAYKQFLTTFSPQMSFEKFIFTIKTSSFTEEHIPKCLNDIEQFDTLLCSLINSAVLTFKFGMMVNTKPEYLFTLLPSFNLTSYFTECCGEVHFSTDPCDINCQFTFPIPKKEIYKEAFKYITTIPKTEIEYYSLILQLNVNREVLIQSFVNDRSPESYLIAHLLLGKKLNTSLTKILSRYIQTYKFEPVQSYAPPVLIKNLVEIWSSNKKGYDLGDISPIRNSTKDYRKLVNYMMNNFID